ncbi:hypothetical protein NDU88_001242 [Pleurodeles waltl]|uniref:Uncharacterized protein n=1 Tax=Pleurodeles waltl TaxID=8319 RepID=A0AAV7Q2J4_PLEWA|nr:hypothetical protein NDU88_001242 [Pleurodeles waltl]
MNLKGTSGRRPRSLEKFGELLKKSSIEGRPTAATLAGLPQPRPGLICGFFPVKKISKKETKSDRRKLTGTSRPAFPRRAPRTSDQDPGLPRPKDFHLEKMTKSEGKNLHQGFPRRVSGEAFQEVGLDWQVRPAEVNLQKND